MNHNLVNHPKTSELESFLGSRLTPEEEQALIQHLDSCVDCRKTLEVTAGSHDWWNEAKEYLSGGRLAHIIPTPTVTQNATAELLMKQLSHILVTSDEPQMIGRIGHYQIAGIIGRGGTGIVLKGFDASLDRFVAIKVLAPELSSVGAAQQRFQREAQAAAAVAHENVIPIYAVSDFQGHSYIVMQYVPGHSLEQRIRQRGPLETIEVLRIALNVARALAAAHEQGLVHRDIKPANILLEEGIDRPMVTDFGLARVADDASLTRSGVVAGTPNYMSPEQSGGSIVDARSDLFSLGSVIYAMCSGHPPFRAETLVGVLRRVCDDVPKSLRGQNPQVPEWMERFVFRLLSKQPDDRFGSAAEVVEILSRELSHAQNPTSYRRPARRWRYESRTALRRRRACLVLISLTLIATAGLWFVFQRSAPTKSQQHGFIEQRPLAGDHVESWDAVLLRTREAAEKWKSDLGPHESPFYDPWDEELRDLERLVRQFESDVQSLSVQ